MPARRGGALIASVKGISFRQGGGRSRHVQPGRNFRHENRDGRDVGDLRRICAGRLRVRPGSGTAGQKTRGRRLCGGGGQLQFQQRHRADAGWRRGDRHRAERHRGAQDSRHRQEAHADAGALRHRYRAASRSHHRPLRVLAARRGRCRRGSRRIDAANAKTPSASRRRPPRRRP